MMFLLAYAVSSALHETFLKNSDLRVSIGGYAPTVVVTDEKFDCEHFQVVDPSIGNGEAFNLAKARNATIKAAIEIDADWIVMLDTDAIWLGLVTFPFSGFGTARIHRTKEGEVIDLQNLELGPSSWFIMRRDVFTRPEIRFCEDYVGYGFEDFDFNNVVMKAAGIEQTPCDAMAIHVWHPQRNPVSMNNHLKYQERST